MLSNLNILLEGFKLKTGDKQLLHLAKVMIEFISANNNIKWSLLEPLSTEVTVEVLNQAANAHEPIMDLLKTLDGFGQAGFPVDNYIEIIQNSNLFNDTVKSFFVTSINLSRAKKASEQAGSGTDVSIKEMKELVNAYMSSPLTLDGLQGALSTLFDAWKEKSCIVSQKRRSVLNAGVTAEPSKLSHLKKTEGVFQKEQERLDMEYKCLQTSFLESLLLILSFNYTSY